MSGYIGKSRYLFTRRIKQMQAIYKSKKKYRGYATHGQLKLLLLAGRGLTTHTHTHTHTNPNEKK